MKSSPSLATSMRLAWPLSIAVLLLGITVMGIWYAQSDLLLHDLILAGGLVLSLLLGIGFWELSLNRRRQLEQAHQSLLAADRFAQGTLDALETRIAVLDAKGVVLTVNHAWRQFVHADVTSWGATDEGGDYLADCAKGGSCTDGVAVVDGIRAVMRGELDCFRLEYRCECRDDTHWYELRVTRFVGTGPQFVVVAHDDITPLKRQELEVEELSTRLHLATEAAEIGIWEYDVVNNHMSWDAVMFRLYGQDPARFPGVQEAWEAALHPDDAIRIHRELQRALSGEQPYDTQFRVVWPNGKMRWIHTKATVFRAADGQPLRMIGTHWDISDFKASEHELLRAKLEAERANQAKSQFLSSMSHELRTPMNAVLGFAQLMSMDTTLPENHQENLEQILKGGSHLLNLINDVLNLTKIEAGDIELLIETVACAELIDECLALVSPLAQDQGIQLETDTTDGIELLHTDRRMLKQVLINLLSNAIKYNRAAGRVRLALGRLEDGNICLSVTDSGAGIPPERLPELFQPFNRLGAELSEIEGSGIGLAVSKRLVTALGGSISVSSTLGVGSVFRVILNTEKTPAPQAKAADSDTGNSAPQPLALEKPEATILNIDDNAANRRLVQKILRQHSQWRLIDAATAEAGIELATAHPPDIILMDINLPDMDGYTALRQLRAQVTTHDIPVIAVSANALPTDLARARVAGFNDYLTKPYEVPRFMALITAQLKDSLDHAAR